MLIHDEEEEGPGEDEAMEQDGEPVERRAKKGSVGPISIRPAWRLTMCSSTLTSAIWSPCGSRIYAGTNQGEVIIFDPLTRQVSELSRACIKTGDLKA